MEVVELCVLTLAVLLLVVMLGLVVVRVLELEGRAGPHVDLEDLVLEDAGRRQDLTGEVFTGMDWTGGAAVNNGKQRWDGIRIWED